MSDPYVSITANGNKIIRNNKGHIIKRYRNIPRNINFRHAMVNDYNQHLSGAWSVYKHYDFEEVDRVMRGLKPIGDSISYNFRAIKDKMWELRNKGYIATYSQQRIGSTILYILTASPKGKLGEFFDMETLATEYERQGFSGKSIRDHSDVNFEKFHNIKYNSGFYPVEIVGLVLGYPIENTISIIRNELEEMNENNERILNSMKISEK